MNKCILLLFLSFLITNVEAKIIFPSKLQKGDKVALITPGFKITHQDLQFAKERIKNLGLEPVVFNDSLNQDGCYAGTIQSRLQELNAAFLNPDIKAIIAIRGGSGCFQLLDKLNYENIIKNPKILLGYSDITALLNTIYFKTGLITFHGPMPIKKMPAFSVDYLSNVIIEGKKVTFKNEITKEDDLIQTENRIITINSGIAQGRLVGGNLSVFTNLIGTEYLPKDSKEWQNLILFIEEVDEDLYRIDRMLGQLQQAGILSNIKGFIFGSCIECGSKSGCYGLEQILTRYFKDLQIPVFSGAMIGHQNKIFTLPIGSLVEMNAELGTITMLEAGVK